MLGSDLPKRAIGSAASSPRVWHALFGQGSLEAFRAKVAGFWWDTAPKNHENQQGSGWSRLQFTYL